MIKQYNLRNILILNIISKLVNLLLTTNYLSKLFAAISQENLQQLQFIIYLLIVCKRKKEAKKSNVSLNKF